MPVGWDKISWTFAKRSAHGLGSRGNAPGGGWGGEAPKTPGLLHFNNPLEAPPIRIESLQEKRNINEDKTDQVDTQQHMTTIMFVCTRRTWIEEVQAEVSLQ